MAELTQLGKMDPTILRELRDVYSTEACRELAESEKFRELGDQCEAVKRFRRAMESIGAVDVIDGILYRRELPN